MDKSDDRQGVYHRRWQRGWLVVFVVLVGGWLGRPRYRAWKLVRFQRQAREFLQQTNLNAAWLASQQAQALNGSNVETLRLMADILGTAQQPQAVGFRRKVAELEPGNATNRLTWAQTALAFEQAPFAETSKALEGVPAEARNSVEYHFIAAALEVKRGNAAAAEEHFAAAVEWVPTNRQARINLAVVQLQSPDEAKRRAAHEALAELRSDPDGRLSVLRSLVSYCRQTEQFDKALEFSKELVALKGKRDGRSIAAGGGAETGGQRGICPLT
jgi:predicted Zn-dependent protease